MYNQLSNQEKMLVNSEVANNQKGVGVAYLLWFFLGSIGVHRMYLGRKGSGVTILLLNLAGWLTLAFFVGIIFLIIVGVWVFIDAFLIPGIVKNENEDLKEEYSKRIIAGRDFAGSQA